MSSRLRSFLHGVGSPVVGVVAYTIDLAAMIGEVLLALLWSAGRLRPVVRDVLYRQVYFTGVRAIPFAAFLSLLVATMVAVQAPYSAAAGGNILGSVLVVVLVRELGPLAAALIVVTRSGTAMAAELATMGVSGETDGLAGMGVEPFEYLVLPRLVGTAISLVALTVLFLATSIFTSALLSPLLNGPSPGALLTLVAQSIHPADAAALLAKTVIPGLAIAAVACREGMSTWRASTDVPPAVTATVVRGLSIIFLWNTVVSALLYLA
jgi:phospholipid/cholesterol/gamma-HCH transport system permease protein